MRILRIDGMDAWNTNFKDRTFPLAPGKRTIVVAYLSSASIGVSQVAYEFEHEFLSGHEYILATDMEYKVFVVRYHLKLVDKTANTQLFLTGPQAGRTVKGTF